MRFRIVMGTLLSFTLMSIRACGRKGESTSVSSSQAAVLRKFNFETMHTGLGYNCATGGTHTLDIDAPLWGSQVLRLYKCAVGYELAVSPQKRYRVGVFTRMTDHRPNGIYINPSLVIQTFTPRELFVQQDVSMPNTRWQRYDVIIEPHNLPPDAQLRLVVVVTSTVDSGNTIVLDDLSIEEI